MSLSQKIVRPSVLITSTVIILLFQNCAPMGSLEAPRAANVGGQSVGGADKGDEVAQLEDADQDLDESTPAIAMPANVIADVRLPKSKPGEDIRNLTCIKNFHLARTVKLCVRMYKSGSSPVLKDMKTIGEGEFCPDGQTQIDADPTTKQRLCASYQALDAKASLVSSIRKASDADRFTPNDCVPGETEVSSGLCLARFVGNLPGKVITRHATHQGECPVKHEFLMIAGSIGKNQLCLGVAALTKITSVITDVSVVKLDSACPANFETYFEIKNDSVAIGAVRVCVKSSPVRDAKRALRALAVADENADCDPGYARVGAYPIYEEKFVREMVNGREGYNLRPQYRGEGNLCAAY